MVRRKKIETDSSIKTGNDELSMVTEIETAPENLSADELEKEFPIMTLRNMVMFPSVVMPVTAGRRTTLKLVHDAMKDKRHIIIATQKVAEVEDPGISDLHPVAVIGRVLRVFEMPGGNTTVILQASNIKVHLDEATGTRPYLRGKVSLIEEQMEPTDSDEFKALMDTCIELSRLYLYKLPSFDRRQVSFAQPEYTERPLVQSDTSAQPRNQVGKSEARYSDAYTGRT